MSLRTLPISLAGFGLALLAFTPSADAHIRLLDPLARYEITGNETGIKSCPCGLGQSPRAGCNLMLDASDPDRSTRVTQAEAGSTLTLRFSEYIGHSGSYRVAFDADGADVADFNSDILVPMVADPPGNMGNAGEGDVWEIEVPLPDMTCDNCTLQLIQAMHGDMVNPVADPGSVSSYYACVDLELVAPGTMGEPTPGAAPTQGTMSPVPAMGDAMSGGNMMGSGGGSTGVGSLMPSTPSTSTTPMGMPNSMLAPSGSGESGGCSLGARAPASPFAALAVAGVFSLLAGRRRARRQR